MKIIKGDLIKLAREGEFEAIIHGCNCFHTMGAGIALRVKEVFPQAYIIDKQTKYGDKSKLGTYSFVEIKSDNRKLLFVINAYTQYDFRGRNNVNYRAIRECMKNIKKRFSGKKIGFPKIGAGLAGGDWKIISRIIDEELEGEDITLVEFTKS